MNSKSNQKQNHSIIREDGSLHLVAPKSEVTWYSLLSATRAANSIAGGWNNKSGWHEYGLCKLVGNDGTARAFVKEWTLNSLSDRAEPLPRQKAFQAALRREALESKSRGSAGGKGPDDRTENSINWNLSLRLFGELGKSAAHCVVYELPLARESDGQLKVDIALFHRSLNSVEIVELKRKDPSDTPLMALVETICYSLQTIRCWPSLCAELQIPTEETAPSHIHIVLGGPRLWETCNPANTGAAIRDDQLIGMKGLLAGIQSAIESTGVRTKLNITFADVAPDGSKLSAQNPLEVPSWSRVIG